MEHNLKSIAERVAEINKAFEPLRNLQKSVAALNIHPKSTLGNDISRLVNFPESPQVENSRLKSELKSKAREIEFLKMRLKDKEIQNQQLRKDYALDREGFVAQRDFFKERCDTLQKKLEQRSS